MPASRQKKKNRVLKIDLHMHTHFSPDSGAPSKSIIDRCLKKGFNCIAVTDHNTIQGAVEVQNIAPFPVIVGEEIRSSAGDIIGLFLLEEVPKGLSPLDTVEAIKDQGGLVMVPHPFDRLRSSAIKYDALQEILPYIDVFEVFNAHNILKRDNDRAVAFSRDHHLVSAAVSDSHTPLELGSTYMVVPDFDGTAKGFKESLARARLVTRRANQILRLAMVYAKLKKVFR